MTINPQLLQNLKKIQELNQFKSISATVEYFIESGFDGRQEIDRVHFDNCHADYQESLVILRKYGTLLNAIVRNLNMQQDVAINYQQLEKWYLNMNTIIKEAIQRLDKVEQALNINNQIKEL